MDPDNDVSVLPYLDRPQKEYSIMISKSWFVCLATAAMLLVVVGIFLLDFTFAFRGRLGEHHHTLTPDLAAQQPTLPGVYASYAVTEIDLIRALVIAYNLQQLGSTHGFVVLTFNMSQSILQTYNTTALRAALNVEFTTYPLSLDPLFLDPPAWWKEHSPVRWQKAWVKVATHTLYTLYSKILLLDIDSIMVDTMDELFNLNVDAITPGIDGRLQSLQLHYTNSGMMFLVPKPSTAQKMLHLINTTSAQDFRGQMKLGDQEYFTKLFAEKDPDTNQTRVPSIYISPQYNANPYACESLSGLLVKNWHMYQYKPWRASNQHRPGPLSCNKGLLKRWNQLYVEMRRVFAKASVVVPRKLQVVGVEWGKA